MPSSYPTTLDAFTNPSGGDRVSSEVGGRTHSEFHSDTNDAIEALEAKVGANGSAVTTSHDYKLSEVSGTDKAVGKTATQTLSNKTLSSPSITSPSITGLDISDAEFAIHDDSDATKRAVFQASSISASTTRTKTFQDVSGILYETGGQDVSIADGGTGASTKSAAYDALSPNTAKGDITVSNGSGNVRLPAGTDTNVLTADSTTATGLKWAPPSLSNKLAVDYTTPSTGSGTLHTAAIAGGNLSTDNQVYARLTIPVISLAVGATLTISAKYGSGAAATIAMSPFSGSIVNGGASIDVYLTALGATNSQRIAMTATWPSVQSAGAQTDVAYQDISVDSTVSQDLVVSVTSTGTANISTKGMTTMLI